MKQTVVEELRALSVDELQTRVDQARRELLQGRIVQVTEGTRRGAAASNTRRNIARMLTIINEKKAEAQA
jgi:large subunit ribosomal protein L29